MKTQKLQPTPGTVPAVRATADVKARVSAGASSGPAVPPVLSAAEAAAGPSEVEFKLVVPEPQSAAVAADLDRHGPVTTMLLHAHYFDTEDDRLAGAGLALRLRQENGRWVQTLKMSAGDGNLRRAEHEVELSPARNATTPAVNLSRHDGTAAGEAARAALQDAAGALAPLVERYATRVARHAAQIAWRGSRIEIAFDQGHLEAAGRSAPVCELEFELKHGDAGTLARLARRWLRRHRLWLGAESKSQRGLRLARGEAEPAIAKATPTRLEARMSADGLARAVVASCLQHILPNAAAVAGGSLGDEHVHQLRVGLRRLRTALRELSGMSADMPLRIEASVAETFRTLGEHRDQQTVLEAVKPQLLAAGARSVDWALVGGPPVDLAAAVRDPAFQRALLDAAGYALAPATGEPLDGAALRRRLRPRLRQLHRQLVTRGERFTKLPVDDQHALRKHLKRLRYLSEFVAPLFGDTEVERYLEGLRPAQDRLGEHNDVVVARDIARRSRKTDADARFAADWLGEAQRRTARRARSKLKKVEQAPRFWRND